MASDEYDVVALKSGGQGVIAVVALDLTLGETSFSFTSLTAFRAV